MSSRGVAVGIQGEWAEGEIRRTDDQCMSEVKERKAFRTIPGV